MRRCLPPRFRRALKARMKARSASRANAAAATVMAVTAVNVANAASKPPRAAMPRPKPMFLSQIRLQRRNSVRQ